MQMSSVLFHTTSKLVLKSLDEIVFQCLERRGDPKRTAGQPEGFVI